LLGALLKHAPAARKSDINKIPKKKTLKMLGDVGIADQQKSRETEYR